MSSPRRTPAPVRPPPRGKNAAYLAALLRIGDEEKDEEEEVEDEEEVEAAKQKPKSKKSRAKGKSSAPDAAMNAAKNRETAADREGKKTKKAAALVKATSAATKKKMAHIKERIRLEKEEKRGADARAAAQARLLLAIKQKKEVEATRKQMEGARVKQDAHIERCVAMEADESVSCDAYLKHCKEGRDLENRFNHMHRLVQAMDEVDILVDQLKNEPQWKKCDCDKCAYYRSPEWLQEQPFDLEPKTLKPKWIRLRR